MSADLFDDSNFGNASNEDPVAEFLAREKAELEKIENNEFANDDFSNFGSNQNQQFDSNGFGDDFGGAQVEEQNEENNQQQSVYAAIQQADKFASEPEKIKKWREEQRERLTKKDAEEEAKKREWRENAKKELDDWYKNRQEQLEKTHANNKAAEAEILSQRDGAGSGQEWDRISKLCDFNPKANKNTKDVSRMRSLLLQLKQNPVVRGHN